MNTDENYRLISSLGADTGSNKFYSKTKSQMEVEVQKIKSDSTYFLRPSLLIGDRQDFRVLERFTEIASSLLSFTLKGPLKKYRLIGTDQVAETMVLIGTRKKLFPKYIENEEIHDANS